MNDETALPLVALGAGGALAAAVIAGRGRDAAPPRRRAPAVDPGAWVFPVPTLADRPAVISDGWGSTRTKADGTPRPHLGADIMFKRRDRDDLAATYRPGTPNGSRWYFMPDGVPVLAASAGTVQLAEWTPRGYSVVIRHPSGWATYYTHLDTLTVARDAQVAAGQPLGTLGFDPTDRAQLKHLHFELWRKGRRAGAVDPGPYLAAWHRAVIPEWTPTPPVRNAGLVYRPVGERGEPYPEWLRRLKGASGVYVIRERTARGKPVVVYVGESHTGRLYETLTRHLQEWRRWKGYWKGQYGEGHDPGLTYDRGSVEVAVKVTRADDALDEEARLIRRLRPRDNLLGQPAEETPF